ncbi:MAG: methyl-accepting chemotaxis protein [Bacillota bacterium]
MKKMSLKAKLLTMCSFLLCLSVLVGATSFIYSNDTVDDFEKIVDISVPKLQLTYKMMLSYRRVRINLRTLGLKGLPENESKKAVDETLAAIKEYENEDAQLVKMGFIPGQKETYDKVNAAWLSFKAVGEEVLQKHKSGSSEDLARIQEIFLKDCPEHANTYKEAVEGLISFNEKAMAARADLARGAARTSNHVIIGIILIGGFLGLAIGLFLATSITKVVASVSKDLASGSDQVNQAANQISESSQNLSQASTQQASALEETVAAMEEITSMVQRNSENGRQAASLAASTREIALKGEQQIKQLIESIYTISADSKKIEEITSVIDDIAFQTNLLALNAAVEAARAGEQGKGFAVVAEAVRTLAHRSSAAAKDIDDLIKRSVERIAIGSQQATQSGTVLNEIVSSIKKVADLNGEISAASDEQSAGISQIGKALNQLDEVTQQNAAGAEEAAAAAEELSAQSSVLKTTVGALELVIYGGPSVEMGEYPSPSSNPLKARSNSKNILKFSNRAESHKEKGRKSVIPFDDDHENVRSLGKAENF